MKIYNVDLGNNVNNIKKQSNVKTSSKPSNVSNNTSKIINNSLSEVLGRSQVVSFSGTKIFGGKPGVIQDYINLLLGREVSPKNRKYDESYFAEEDSYPFDDDSVQEEEVITETDGRITTVKTRTPDGTSIVERDENGEIYSEYVDKRGNKEIVRTEREVGRIVRTRVLYGQTSVEVIDLNTNMHVYHGPLTYDTTYEQDSDMYVTRNMVNGKIVKAERLDKDCKVLYSKEYSEDTGEVVRTLQYDKKKDCYYENVFHEDGTLYTKSKISEAENKVIKYTYNYDGTIASHVASWYDDEGNVVFERKYNPETRKPVSDEDYVTKQKILYNYDEYTGRLKTREFYEGDTKTQEVFYYKNGKTPKVIKNYERGGFSSEILYNRAGQKEAVRNYSFDGEFYYSIEYNPETGNKVRTVEVDYSTKNHNETVYNEQTGRRVAERERTKDGRMLRYTFFYEDGKTPSSECIYDEDGSYVETIYSEYGLPISETAYTADHEIIDDNQAEVSEKFMKDVLAKMSSNKELSKSDWKKLCSFFGLEDKSELENIDKKTYRTLMKKYHPDLVSSKEDIPLCTVVSTILNEFYDRSENKE